jgi:hypothetical protein
MIDNNFTLIVIGIAIIALGICLALLHRQNDHLKRMMDKHRFVPIDRHGVIFEPAPECDDDPDLTLATEQDYDFVRGKGRFGTQHQYIDGNGE